MAVNGRDPERGEAARRALAARAPGAEIAFLPADVSRPAEVAALVERAAETFGGRIDVLVNAAGGDHAPTLFGETDLDEIEAVIRTWLIATIQCCRCALPHIPSGGAIVNVASDAAKVPTPGESVIGAAMAGIAMFSRTLAMEAKRGGVRVNVVTPSLVTDTLTHARITAGGFSAKLFREGGPRRPSRPARPRRRRRHGRVPGRPEASRMTGQVVSVNGGISAG